MQRPREVLVKSISFNHESHTLLTFRQVFLPFEIHDHRRQGDLRIFHTSMGSDFSLLMIGCYQVKIGCCMCYRCCHCCLVQVDCCQLVFGCCRLVHYSR